ncbi:hypothetical protein SODALDRAFT_280232 [Sodiomyces alkalinus F11]|uniref:Sister chromatid separation protein n=1 Tax=Sodiomyces alkalinus (strain CBS 110278 / VKM F-3762 / F11) TaxID=1314773 RepID=A0A3N2PS50_SODAK|nr:hypothetical protein SODALDRAFT_280232 [Sodiomyces alkalinus F11]ROT37254.1 hypothetical protein SODALDRAFT_280232 [Sodiomyces alkalinus F11]
MEDEYDYLQPGFDPKTLTVPRLRSILVAHDVQYPGTAKKSQLIELYYEGVVPKAKKFLDKQARAKRSSMGIVDMPSGNSASFDDSDLQPPTQTRRSRSPRKASARIKPEEQEEPEPVRAQSPTKRRVRGTSRQLSHPPDEDDRELLRSPRRTTRNVTPQVKVEESDDDFFRRTREAEGPFSSDNPFQSGSSPLTAPRSASSRRRTAGQEPTTPHYEKEARRRTDGHAALDGPKSSKSRKSFEVPVSKFSGQQTPEVHDVDAGEEFTPEEQFELELEMASKGQTAVQPRQTQAPKRRSGFKVPIMALGVTLLSAYAGWYRQEKIAVGYCGLGRPATQIIPPEVPVPDWAVPFIEPQCEPCPQHAYCYEDFSVRCEPDFVLKPHPLSAGGILPLPPTCEPDGEKVRRVKVVADKVVEELRERRARFECGELVDEAGRNDEGPGIAEDQLRKTISDKRSKRMNEQEFDDLWLAALGDVKEREEIEVVDPTNQTGYGGTRTANSSGVPITYLSSTSLARLSLGCAAKRSFRLGLERYRLPAGSLSLLAILYFYARSRYRSYKSEMAQVPALVDLVLSRLAAQKELGEEEIDEPWLFLPNLRDDVLRSVHSLGDRDRIWKRVRAVVEQNSNVRTSQRESRNGEVGRAWEWIGPIGGEAARRRRSGRISFGADVEKEETPEMVHKTEKGAGHSRWEESRPVY